MNHLKVSFILLFLICLFYTSSAQNGFGLKGGLNLSKIKGDNKGATSPDDVYEFAGFYHVGVYWGIPLTENISIKPEALFSVKGTKLSESGNTIFDQVDGMQISYLSFPLLLNLQIGSFAIDLGPEFSYKVDAKTQKGDIDLDYFYNKDVEVSGVVGLNFCWNKVHVGARYNLGLTSINDKITFTDENGLPLFYAENEKNQLIQFSIGFQLL